MTSAELNSRHLQLPSDDRMYQAVAERDTRFEGIFVMGVRTTGIFCRPGCTARTPKRENVEFFATARQALAHGYRPCKVCRPMEPAGAVPDWVRGLLGAAQADPSRRWTDQDLRERNLEPTRVRRWFKKHHGMTFHAYSRLLRLNKAFGRIRSGDSIAPAAFGAGYESLSGFADAIKQATGKAPSSGRGGNSVTVSRIPSPLGPMVAGATDEGVCLLEFTDRRMLVTQIARLRKWLRADIFPGEHPHIDALHAQLKAYFEGSQAQFDLPLVTPGTPFQEQVWQGLREIPYGQTRSYQEQAARIGRPEAVRAVARANGDNRIAIVIPCHRVIGKDGKLSGYGGGLWRKRFLLDLESEHL